MMNTKCFCLLSVLFLLILVSVDFIFGNTINYLFRHAKGGELYREKYICEQMDADVVVFGSSRAIHHYDTNLLSDSLQMNCFNAGFDGNGILLMYAQYKMITERHVPKYIIYDINPDADYYYDGDKHRFLNPIRAYYDSPGIDSLFWRIDELDKIKFFSRLYRYNTVFTQYISAYFSKEQQLNKGWKPMDKIMTHNPKEDELVVSELQNKVVDDVKRSLFFQLIGECRMNGTQLIFMVSPYFNNDGAKYNVIKQIAKDNNIPFISYASNARFRKNRNYFYDSVHLNRKGATAFTEAIIKDLRNIIHQQKENEDSINRHSYI